VEPEERGHFFQEILAGGEILLPSPDFRLFENGNELAVKTLRESAPKPAFSQKTGRKQFHTIALTVPIRGPRVWLNRISASYGTQPFKA
jgi:hypothetical protein